MWDRLKIIPHGSHGSHTSYGSGRHGGHPLDDDRLRVGLGIGYGATPKGYSYSIKGGPAPPRPPREFYASRYLPQPAWCPSRTSPAAATLFCVLGRDFWIAALETAPAVKEPPRRNPNRITVRTANINLRPPSSVYSSDDDDYSPPLAAPVASYNANLATTYDYRYGGGPGAADEISPPSSPEVPVPQSRGNTSIPVMRRERRRQSDIAARENHRGTQLQQPQQQQQKQFQQQQQQQQQQPQQQQQQQYQDQQPRNAPRWDPLTGEQTGNAQGYPSQVANPAEFAQGLATASQSAGWSDPQQSVGPTAGPPSFGDRWRRMAKKAGAAAAAARDGNTDPAAGAFTSTRPGWRGASGRTAIVDPVHDTRAVAPLKIPEKSSRRNMPPSAGPGPAVVGGARVNNSSAVDGPVRRGQTPPISPPPSETPPARSAPQEAARRIMPSSQTPAAQTAQTQFQTTQQQQQRYPSPPLSGTPVQADAPAVAAARELVRDAQYGVGTGVSAPAQPSPTFNNSPESINQLRRKPPPVHTDPHHPAHYHHQHQVSVSSVYSTDIVHQSPGAIHDVVEAVEEEEPYVQPPSRFSITTYATSTAGTTRTDDPDDHFNDDHPPVPSLPSDYQHQYTGTPGGPVRPTSDHSPVTSPIDQFMTSPFSVPPGGAAESRSPSTDPEQQQELQQFASAMNPALARALAIDRPSSRASDINKSLPAPPPEQTADQARDRVGLLNAQLRSLANRRININRSIAQMTELMPTDKLMNSAAVVRKREDEKKKVEVLRQELADVQREEYELGLKLHRAYKRLDREAEWEPTTLWVRRVTK
ncbi:uncharacterized protein C8A04DRAFT_14404 [Dichotomopilus funicola]|uniref:Uncharacterized protein n=1 Tax=Dichotomopilus funicola TaxID=1934379 RepID=A0AAN6UXK6_9PEZI|nr:hypothetical protein C8A04DRAFT_14404 [Dichotomopilus funicola]